MREQNDKTAGIYIHIPFCRRACHYCNFHFSTTQDQQADVLTAVRKELTERRLYAGKTTISSIYFGGGTPSLLPPEEISLLIEAVAQHYSLESAAEITLEANPDDISELSLKAYKKAGINRLSIGIQSFLDRDLRWMNRSHDSRQAVESLRLAAEAGFAQLTADLIYGIPGQTHDEWRANIAQLLEFPVHHISCYALTVEPGTALHHFIQSGKMHAPDDTHSAEQFETLIDTLAAAGFEHYEISNFARNGHYARHNTAYWKGAPYIGIGPSAHSYTGNSRRWNISNNSKYRQLVTAGDNYWEEEMLSTTQQMNEYIMLSLRTMWGLDLSAFKEAYGEAALAYLLQQAGSYLAAKLLLRTNDTISVSRQGLFIADGIISDLFFID